MARSWTKSWPGVGLRGTSCHNPARARGSADSNGRRPRGQTRPANRARANQKDPSHMTVETSTWATKKGLAQMLKGGVIMDVVTPDQAKIAEDAGAVAVMALERVPADIRKAGGVARMSDPVDDRGDHGRGDHPGHGQGPHRPLRRGAGPRGARRRLHRRVRGPHPGRRDATTSTSTPSRSRSCAAAGTSARRCAGSTRARR